MTDKVRIAGKYDEYSHRAKEIRKNQERPNYDKSGKRIGESTHKMSHEYIDGRWVAFPTLFPDKDAPGRWKDYTPTVQDAEGNDISRERADIQGAYLEPSKRGERFEFGQDEEESRKFSEGSWKGE